MASATPEEPYQPPSVIIVVGAPGEKEFEEQFLKSAELLTEACREAGTVPVTIGMTPPDEGTTDLEHLKSALDQHPPESDIELWLVLLGHGTFDGKEAKFNLRGPDLSAAELAKWLEPFKRPLAVVNAASSSGPFLKALSGQNRVIVTANRSGYEHNYARFGQFFAEAISSPKSDLDKDDQVSLLEAFLTAAHGVAEFYKTEGRLATEHALIDDNGDGLGTPPDWFRGIRAIKKPASGASMDGLRAHQHHLIRSETERKLSPAMRAKRNELELAVEELRSAKSELAEDDYYQRLEVLMLQLASLYLASETAR